MAEMGFIKGMEGEKFPRLGEPVLPGINVKPAPIKGAPFLPPIEPEN